MIVPAESIRNLVLLGHGSEGKTTLAEAMLYVCGTIDRMGKVEDGSTVLDSDPEETRRGISISAAVAGASWKDHKINIIDVPGYFDFIGEAAGPLRVADAALILLGSTSPLSVGAEKAWTSAERLGVPRVFIINQMDRENANYDKVVNQITDVYGAVIVPTLVPILVQGAFKGYVDIMGMKAYEFAGKGVKEIPIPADMQSAVDAHREHMVEAVAGADDALMEKYFEGEELTAEELCMGMRKGIAAGLVVPVLCAASVQALCVSALLDFANTYLPSPKDHAPMEGKNPRTGEKETRACDTSAPFSAQVFKTVADPFVGKLSLVKIMSGTLTGDMALYNPAVERTEKAGTLYILKGKKQSATEQLSAGEIGALAKLQYTMTGHTLCDANKPIVYEPIRFPKPSISMAVSAKKQGEEDKVFSGLSRLAEEDPSFSVSKNTETAETIISGQGELHLDVIGKKLQGKFGVEAVLSDPSIPYRETIRKAVKVQGRHKKQSGGHGQFGDCWIEFEPLFDGTEFEFVDKVVGGVVPKQFIPAVEKGLRENLPRGIVAGYPVVGVRATLYDGSYHPVDSSEMAFKTAARIALRKCAEQANPTILEPIYAVKVFIPDEYMGDVIGDMNRRRGRIMGMNPAEDGGQCVEAEVPLSEMFKYATDLRSMTQARGSFEMDFVRYEEVPSNIAQKIIENSKMVEEEE